MAYLVDIFASLNELVLSMQGPNATGLNLSEKIVFPNETSALEKNWMKIKCTSSAFSEEYAIEADKG